jgi:hypothetical protein
MNKEHFPDFLFSASHIVRYISTAGLFSLLLSSGQVIHFEPENKQAFSVWLRQHNIPTI